MRVRKVIVTLELLTDGNAKRLADKDGWDLMLRETFKQYIDKLGAARCEQAQINVVKRGGHGN